MEIRRFYVDKNSIFGDRATLIEEERNHLVNVLRVRETWQVILVCGDGFDYLGHVSLITKSTVEIEIDEKTLNLAEPKRKVSLFQGVAKGEKMELITQKITELGLSKLIPFTSDFTVPKESSVKLDRLDRITKESIKQCKRSNPLEISEVVTFDGMISQLADYDLVIFAYEKATKPMAQHFSDIESLNNVAIIVGAEGGFSESEAEQIVEANAKMVTLGKRILRLETASIVLSGLVMYNLEEMN